MHPRVAFVRILGAIQSPPSFGATAERHVATVRSRLRDAFTLRTLFLVGSHKRDTAIKGYSDVDTFAVVARDDARWGDRYITSDTALDRLRVALQGRFPQTQIRRDVQAVVVYF